MIRLQKLLSIFSHRKELWNQLGRIVYNKNQSNALKKYKISELETVTVNDFFKKLHIDNEPVKITTDFSNGISPENDYYFLCKIAKALNIKNYFEIGTWVGLSAKNISDNVPGAVIHSLDIPHDHHEIRHYG